MSQFRPTGHLLESCAFAMPERSKVLQQYMYQTETGPRLEQNSVIAKQSECPNFMSLKHYEALGSLLLGRRVRWMNILIHLADSAVDWRTVESAMFIQQLFQIGKAMNSSVREVHKILQQDLYAESLLEAVSKAFGRVKDNTSAYAAVASVAALVTKVLANGPATCHDKCFSLLEEFRKVCMHWITSLKNRKAELKGVSEQKDCDTRIFEIAMICCSTFYLDKSHLEQQLSSHVNCLFFVLSSISIQERAASYQSNDPFHQCLYFQWQRISTQAAQFLADQVVKRGKGFLSAALEETWPSFRPQGTWKDAHMPWLVVDTKPHHGGPVSPVHFNVLTAEILVNGHPVNYIPSDYLDRSDFKTVFGSSQLEVAPSTTSTFHFSVKKPFNGYEVSLGIFPQNTESSKKGSDLRVVSTKSGNSFYLLPSRLLHGVLPTELLQKYVHWYNSQSDSVEFRPVSAP